MLLVAKFEEVRKKSCIILKNFAMKNDSIDMVAYEKGLCKLPKRVLVSTVCTACTDG